MATKLTLIIDYGTQFLPSGVFEKHPNVDRLLFHDLNGAIASCADSDKGKRIYLRAVTENPQLVLLESDPLRFLQQVNENPRKAAGDLIQYWKKRHLLLGEEGALQPMSFQNELNFLPSGIIEKHPEEDPLDFKGLNDALVKSRSKGSFFSKEKYLKALALAPKLVLLESDPLRFLLANDMEFEKAAEHLMRYWSKRYDLFGEEDFVKPMTFFNGALNEADRDHVRKGNMVFTRISPGIQPVAMMDSSRIESTCRETVLRGSFYHMQFGSDLINPKKGRGGILLGVFTDRGVNIVDFEKAHMFLSCFTARFDKLTLFDIRRKQSRFRVGFRQFMNLLYEKIFATMGCDIELIGVCPVEEILEILSQHGIRQDAIPHTLGGTFDYSQFDTFLQARIGYENKLYGGSDDVPLLVDADPQTNSQQRLAFESFEMEANIQALPPDDQKCYWSAKRQTIQSCWKHESSLLGFLQVEEGNARLAARRLIGYWKLRANVFEGHKYEPLTQNGEDALQTHELDALDKGFVYPLPKDNDGRPVVLIDSEKEVDRRTRRRCIFYMFSVVSEDPTARIKGVVVVYKLGHSCRPIDGDLVFLDKLGESLAIKIHKIRQVLQNGTPVEEVQSWGNEEFPIEEAARSPPSDNESTATAARSADPNRTMAGDGSSSGLPTALESDHSSRMLWLKLRTRIEWGLPVEEKYRSDPRFPWLGDLGWVAEYPAPVTATTGTASDAF